MVGGHLHLVAGSWAVYVFQWAENTFVWLVGTSSVILLEVMVAVVVLGGLY